MNVLISSISGKVPLIKAAREALARLDGKAIVIGCDCDENCIGQYFVEKFWHAPPLVSLSPENFITYCRREKIGMIIPTRDGELLFFAVHRNLFRKEGIFVMISNAESVGIALDKLAFYGQCSLLGFPVVETALVIDDLSCDAYVVKERWGSGAENTGLNLNEREARAFARRLREPVFQPFFQGKEVSADLYLDQGGICAGVVLRKRLVVIDGEAKVTETFRDAHLEKMLISLAEQLNFCGHVMFQVLLGDKARILECNPRFGGASTLSLRAGLDSFYRFFSEAYGKRAVSGELLKAKEKIRLIRYPEDLIL